MIKQGCLTKANSKAHIQKQSDKEAKIASKQISALTEHGTKEEPMMKQPTFYWDTGDNYNKLKNFRLEVYNVFKSYDMADKEENSTQFKMG